MWPLAGGRSGDLKLAGLRADATVVVHVKLGRLPGRGQLVLDHQHTEATADHLAVVFEMLHRAEVKAHRGVVAKRPAPGGIGRAAGDTGPLAQLVCYQDRGAGTGDRATQPSERLG
jgi:hypothetical protein